MSIDIIIFSATHSVSFDIAGKQGQESIVPQVSYHARFNLSIYAAYRAWFIFIHFLRHSIICISGTRSRLMIYRFKKYTRNVNCIDIIYVSCII